MYKMFKDVWEKTKNKYEFGKDYIDLETSEYIVICPFFPEVMFELDGELFSEKSKFHFSHCLCHSFQAFSWWYKTLYKDGRIKAFFIRKDINLSITYNNQPLTAEFTGWIDFSNKDFLYFAHLVNNHAATGFYASDGKGLFSKECALSTKIDKTCKNEVEEINHALHNVFDDLFNLYDLYVDTLEDRLHNFLDEYDD